MQLRGLQLLKQRKGMLRFARKRKGGEEVSYEALFFMMVGLVVGYAWRSFIEPPFWLH